MNIGSRINGKNVLLGFGESFMDPVGLIMNITHLPWSWSGINLKICLTQL